MQLPPKRYQDDGDPKFDNIRHLPWFNALGKRRDKIELLAEAYIHYMEGMPQNEAVAEFKVDARDMRDYAAFRIGISRLNELEPKTAKVYQLLLDHAYDTYMAIGAERAFTKVMYEVSQFYGVNPRAVVELWEICPAFYPTHYSGFK